MTDTGRPYWSKTKEGNCSQAIPNLWNRLWDLVQRDYPDFPWLPFNSLKDTSANFVRRIGASLKPRNFTHRAKSKPVHQSSILRSSILIVLFGESESTKRKIHLGKRLVN